MRHTGLPGNGVVVTDARGTVVAKSLFSGLGAAAVLLHGTSEGGVVIGNEIVDNRGASNWHAGVVVTARAGSVATEPSSIL
jgi:hypothetical protein